MANLVNTKTAAGHILKLLIDNKEIGRAQSIDGQQDFGTENQYQIGSIMPQESIPLRFQGTVTVDKFLIRQASLAELGLAPMGVAILLMDVIDIQVIDRYSGLTIETYHGCSLQTQSKSFRANAIVGENATWTYLYPTTGSQTGTPAGIEQTGLGATA